MNNKQGGDHTQEIKIDALVVTNDRTPDVAVQLDTDMHPIYLKARGLEVRKAVADLISSTPLLAQENKRLKEVNEKMLEALKDVKEKIAWIANRKETPKVIAKILYKDLEIATAAIKLAE